MMLLVGKGQPPKDPKDVKGNYTIYVSTNQRDLIEEAREIESPDKRFGAYLRDSAVDHAKKVVEESKK